MSHDCIGCMVLVSEPDPPAPMTPELRAKYLHKEET